MRLRDIAIAPILVSQALWVAARATRLPEASGDRAGETGQGLKLRVLILGDSSAAGVGVATQSDALGGQLARHLSCRWRVQWRVVARSGGTVRSATRQVQAMAPTEYDVVLIALGVNDVKNGVSLNRWITGFSDLLTLLSTTFGPRMICVSGVPPIGRFPILPTLLGRVLGARAAIFDEHVRRIVRDRRDTVHLPLDFTLDTAHMASDGFHPGPAIYAEWAKRTADLIDRMMAPGADRPALRQRAE